MKPSNFTMKASRIDYLPSLLRAQVITCLILSHLAHDGIVVIISVVVGLLCAAIGEMALVEIEQQREVRRDQRMKEMIQESLTELVRPPAGGRP